MMTTPNLQEGRSSSVRQFLGWCVHLYTGLGLLAAAGCAVLIVDGGAGSFRGVFLLMLIATLVDATDGTLARWVRIKEAVPHFDGRRLDDLIDFLMYTCLPLLLIWRSGLLPGALAWILLLPLLASAYGFCQLAAKTADGYFLGFPSYWNVVAFYLYVLQPSPEISAVLIVILSLLTFLPTRYLYPSQAGWLNRLACILGLLWAGLVAWVIWRLPTGDAPPGFHSDPDLMWPALLSISFPVYYLLVSWLISWRYYREGRQSYSPGV